MENLDENIPLLGLTRKPLLWSTFCYGGDDIIGFCEEYLPNHYESSKTFYELREKYASEKDEEARKLIADEHFKCRQEVINNAQKIFSCHDSLCNDWNKTLQSIEWNATRRLQIVDALGGAELCKTIPIISIDKKKFDEYMHLGLSDIPEGNSIVQFEDPAGRKGVILKLRHKTTGDLSVMLINQRYRETCVRSLNDGGGLWMGHGKVNPRNVDQIVKFLNDPGEYELVYKSK